MSSNQRIGVFGGTFDPIHNAHIDIAHTVMSSASLDLVLFVVSASPPHKQNGVSVSPEQRYALVDAALEKEAGLEPSDVEIFRQGPSYMANTLSELSLLYPESELFLIVGLDSLVDIPNWRAPEEIYRLAHLLTVSRPGEERKIPPELEGKYDLIPFEESGMSSTEIRRKIRAGESIDGLVPQEAIRIIEKENLYVQ